MSRRRMSTTRRAKIFKAANGICHICGCKIDGTKEAWDADHVIPLEISGDDSDENLRPAHRKCHQRKTAKEDAPTIAKCKRVEAKHSGAHRSKSTLPGSRDSKWKRKINGTVERRE
ncbi:HNH endonuclease [Pseudophaeobacter sp. 1A09344]|uniref:HNH endonuclease n=1 Tax=Pseudophaeobacter sp. 1A09344 TaxID=3098144 RepID=UPI0034D426B2